MTAFPAKKRFARELAAEAPALIALKAESLEHTQGRICIVGGVHNL